MTKPWELIGQDWTYLHPDTGRFAKVSSAGKRGLRVSLDGGRLSKTYRSLAEAKKAAERMSAVELEDALDVSTAWTNYRDERMGSLNCKDSFYAGWKAAGGQ